MIDGNIHTFFELPVPHITNGGDYPYLDKLGGRATMLRKAPTYTVRPE